MVMMWVSLWGPLVLAAMVGLAIHLSTRRLIPRQLGVVGVFCAFAGGVPALVIGSLRVAHLMPWGPIGFDLGIRAALPIALGIGAIALLLIRPSTPRPAATASLAPRTMRTFTSLAWIITLPGLVLAIVALTWAAGAASVSDHEGYRTMYEVTVGTAGSVGTTIYGWYYSLPSLLLLAALVALTIFAWWWIPRRAWDGDVDRDTAFRRLQASNIGRAACGALLVHLGVVLSSLAATSELGGVFSSDDLGTVRVGASFAAIGALLWWSGEIVRVAGLAMWVIIALTGMPTAERRASTHHRTLRP